VLEFQNLYLEKQRDLQQRESKLMSPIIGRLVKLVQQLGERGEYTMILEKNDSRILFAQQSLDLTNEVIRLYNSGKKKKKE
jgi:outer membrane protein